MMKLPKRPDMNKQIQKETPEKKVSASVKALKKGSLPSDETTGESEDEKKNRKQFE
jgi:hypothetical protein